jgi:hypothetical protein
MTMQKRPLAGMVQATGEAKPIALGNGVATAVHTEDVTNTQQGGPFADEVTIFVNNPTGGALNATLTINGVATLTAVGAGATVKVLDGAVFRSADGSTAAVITGQGSGAGLIAWGWFMRPL